MDMSELLIKMLTFVVLMLVGYVGARKGVLTPEYTKGTSKMVMNVFLPASVINSVVGAGSDMSGAQIWTVMGLMFLTIFFCYLVAAIKRCVLRQERSEAVISELLMAVPNTMFVGLPVLQSVYGPTAVLYLALSNIPFNLALYSYGVWRLRSGHGDNAKFSFNPKDLLTVPMVATLIALVIFLLKLPLPRVVQSMASTISAGTMPLSMIVIGATLGPVNLLDTFKEKRVYFICFVRLLLCPFVLMLFLKYFIPDPVLLASCVIVAGCPSGILVTVLALQYKYDAVYSSKGVLASTSLSMLTMPLLVLLLSL